MGFQIGGTTLDFLVLAILRQKDEYGYTLTQKVQLILEVSESSIYPALKRLQKNGMLSSYDSPFQGRNRRYYKITTLGLEALEMYSLEWNDYKNKMDELLKGEFKDEKL
uniref:PadR family transcriptional regulator n=1 Tax=Carnobacterium sp. TaxID=48221 RepID=UPI00345007DE